MGANRVSHLPMRTQSAIWTSSHSSSVLAAARAIGVIDFYSAKTGQRSSLKPLALPSSIGRPTTISLRPSSSPPTYPLVVIGTASGHVLLDQDIALQIGPGPILASQYHDSSIVVVGGPGNSVAVINPTTRDVMHRFSLAAQHLSPITRVVIQDDSHALFCSQALTYVDLTSGKVKRRFIGHKTAVTAAVSASSFVITACEDSFLSIWSTDPVSRDGSSDVRTKRRRTANVGNAETTLVAPYSGVRDLYVDEERNFCFTVVALMSTGDFAIWRSCDLSKISCEGSAHMAPRPATFLVQANSVNVHAALFSKRGHLTIFRGSPLKPFADTVSLEGGSAGVNIKLPKVQDAFFSSNENDVDRKLELVRATAKLEISNSAPVEVLDTNLRRAKPKVDAKYQKEEKKSEDEVDQPSDSLLAQETKSADIEKTAKDEEDEEPTLEEKLKALGIDNAESASKSLKRPGGNGSLLEATRLDSRASVLLQAVRVKDSKMMEACIYNMTKAAIIHNTIKRIPSHVAVGELLEMLIQRLRDRHEQVEILSLWIKVILMEHAGAMISQRQQDAISALACVIEDRTRSLDTLSRLQGRLELIVGQSRRIKPFGPSQLTPAAEYVEDEDDEDDEEDEEEEGDDNDSSGEEGVEGEGEGSGEETESGDSMVEEEDAEKEERNPMQVENGLQNHDDKRVGIADEGTPSRQEGIQHSDIRPNGLMSRPDQNIEQGESDRVEQHPNGKMDVSDSGNSDEDDSDASGDDNEGED